MNMENEPLRIMLLSIHGLIRGQDLELGRDADTGGQTKYVVELAEALGERDDVGRVDLLTRRVIDAQISDDYACELEELSDKVRIVRIECGEEAYLPKEDLWDNLDSFVDRALDHIRAQDVLPHVIHAHYADAGYVGVRLAGQLGLPLVFTAHSLGRVKRRRLLAGGVPQDRLETMYNISRRITAEEATLGAADLVITSTRQEVDAQYGLYDYYRPDQMQVVPPGVDLQRFFPVQGTERRSSIYQSLRRFLREPEKPMVLALARADKRKNITALIEAFGESPDLQRLANLVIVAGNRSDIREMEPGVQSVLNDILLAVDRYDLYGKVAYPKHHRGDDVSVLYRLAAMSQGVFVNPALTEPFGLTLLEAAASGLPIVATDDGGPTDIIENCRNGYLVNPLDTEDIAAALIKILTHRSRWQELATNGLAGVREHYSWQAHTSRYTELLKQLTASAEPERREPPAWSGRYSDRAIFSDLDKNLLSDPRSLAEFSEVIKSNRRRAVFGIATGRRLDSALKVIRMHGIPQPDVLITSLGTDIYYAPLLIQDTSWREHIDHNWNPRSVRQVLSVLPGLKLQPKEEQGRYKISYYYDPRIALPPEDIKSLLLQADLSVNLIVAFGQFLDVVPIRASKGAALRWYATNRGVPLEQILAAGGSGADEDMMRGNTLAVVVGNRHHEELSDLTETERVYFAEKPFAAGILEAIEYYDFFGTCRAPES